MAEVVIAVHGGAGRRPSLSPSRLEARREGLARSLRAGLAVLRAGRSAVDAVVAAVAVLEDAAEFNAGRGSALTASGSVEMDAAVADGGSGKVGAVAAVQGVRNPILAARAVLDDGRHVLLAGPAAAGFAQAAGLVFEPEEWFVTRRRRQELAEIAGGPGVPPEITGGPGVSPEITGGPGVSPEIAGGPGMSPETVGAVAIDRDGHLAAATSTGGWPGQAPGRVGDTPIPGAGTWADDRTCAVSATGAGEALLRAVFAHEVDAQLRLGRCDLETACQRALASVAGHGGTGGCLALDRSGHLVMPFATAVMDRGLADAEGRLLLGLEPGPLSPYPAR